jgi:hypothetical protein
VILICLLGLFVQYFLPLIESHVMLRLG